MRSAKGTAIRDVILAAKILRSRLAIGKWVQTRLRVLAVLMCDPRLNREPVPAAGKNPWEYRTGTVALNIPGRNALPVR